MVANQGFQLFVFYYLGDAFVLCVHIKLKCMFDISRLAYFTEIGDNDELANVPSAGTKGVRVISGQISPIIVVVWHGTWYGTTVADAAFIMRVRWNRGTPRCGAKSWTFTTT